MEVIFEDENLLIINKPAGIRVHGDGKSPIETLADIIAREYPEIRGVGEPMRMLHGGEEIVIDRPGIVHRLDEETSGAMVIAKTQESFEYLKSQFKDRQVQKEYHAFVWGHFKETSGIVDASIGRNKGDFRQWQAGRGIRGESRDALTRWSVLSQFVDEKENQFSFMQLFPKTGRTHQLRVHMKYLQRPIVSDGLYAATKPRALGFQRVALHARKITFLGQKGDQIEVSAPYPEDFQTALAEYVNS